MEDEYVVIIIKSCHEYEEIRQETFDAQTSQSDSDDSDDEENLQIDREIQEEQDDFWVPIRPSDSDDSDDEEKEELSINDFKTFKLEQCVICLEEEPKVLFCNCGHICICKKCIICRYDNCPVCKEKSTILRMIE